MKLWDKGYTTDNVVDKFTVGNDRVLDLKLAKHDVIGNIAHAKMLHKIKVLTDTELSDVLFGLSEISKTIEDGSFVIEVEFEDVHSKIEFELVKLIGSAGKKIHTARSRNDQVLVDLHLYTKEEILKIKTAVLADSWLASKENFVINLTQAGTSSSIYLTEKAALQEFIQGMIGITDEVASGKINDPLSQQDLKLEESQFSHNSKNDFANNIRSVSNVYNGKFNISGLGLYDIVKAKDTALADRLNTEINDAITSIDAISGTFSDAVFNDKNGVETAKNKILKVQSTLEEDILPIINEL